MPKRWGVVKVNSNALDSFVVNVLVVVILIALGFGC